MIAVSLTGAEFIANGPYLDAHLREAIINIR